MAVCPHCEAKSPNVLDPCPNGDGYYCVEEEDFAAHKGEDLLGVAVADRFIVLALLGTGSMAHVYRAHQLEVDRSVALKVFRADALLKHDIGTTTREEALRQARSRFAQEAKVLGRLAHPNCVTVYDFGSADDGRYLYIAMEFVGGLSLRRAVNRGLKLDAIVEICEQVLAALREAHALGVVHRDLKPENIILSFKYANDEPVVKVVDFGIAKLLGRDRAESFTNFGALFGTPAYMSPEQCRGEVDEVGPHSDVYALGCILFEMVCGRLPFESKVPVEMIRMHVDNPVPEVVPRPGLNVPDGFAEFITTCMQKEPRDRYPDAQAAMHALRRVVGDEDEAGNLRTSNVWRRTSSRAGGKGKVVVPANRIAGLELDPPTSQSHIDLEALESQTAERRVVVQERGLTEDSAPGVLETFDNPKALSEEERTGSIVNLVVILAFLLLLGACVALFYFIWQSTRV